MGEKRQERFHIVETSHTGISKEIILTEGKEEGILEIAKVTISVGQEVGMHDHEGFMETWQILDGVGLMSFIEGNGSGERYNIRLGKGNVSQAIPGDIHGIVNIGRNDLIILVTKTLF